MNIKKITTDKCIGGLYRIIEEMEDYDNEYIDDDFLLFLFTFAEDLDDNNEIPLTEIQKRFVKNLIGESCHALKHYLNILMKNLENVKYE